MARLTPVPCTIYTSRERRENRPNSWPENLGQKQGPFVPCARTSVRRRGKQPLRATPAD
uniref:Uncharacterized protein n=1 Tax=Arundo donax TaxID=35708 RepID=A0A0A9AQA0_ARUDO